MEDLQFPKASACLVSGHLYLTALIWTPQLLTPF